MQYVKKDDDGHHVKCQRDDPERVGFLRDDASFVWDAPPLPKRRTAICLASWRCLIPRSAAMWWPSPTTPPSRWVT